jgi:molecular chaperone DnaJ
VVLHVKEHDFFSREEDHLFCEIPISFVQAALGDKIKIPVIGDEDNHELKIPQGTQPGEILSLPGQGMPSLRKNRRGDLFVKITVKIPKRLNQRQKELLEEFSQAKGSGKSKKGKYFWNKMKE